MKQIRVWDVAVRFFHWSQVALLGGLWWTADEGLLDWHQVLAYTLAALLIARVVWAFVGSETARFSHFVQSPIQALKNWNKAKNGIGHQGVSSYMVLALLALVLAQFVTGLFTSDDILVEGPLYGVAPSEWSSVASWWHRNAFDWLLVLIAVHVLAALVHGLQRDGVLWAMFSGKMNSEVAQPKEKPFWVYVVIAGVVLAGFVLWQGPLFEQTLF